MKKFLLIVLLFPTICFSQIKLGAQIGLNSSSFTNEFDRLNTLLINTESNGINIGLTFDYPISEKISFYPKLIYNQIGDRTKDYSFYVSSGKIDYKLDYINFPLNIKFFNKPYLLIGPQVGFLINQKKQSLNFGDIQNKIDFGANIGLGYEINQFSLEIAFYQGLTNILEFTDQRDREFVLRNSFITLCLIYNFQIEELFI